MNLFLPTTGFLDTEIAPVIKPTPPKKNKGQNVYTKSWLNGWDLQYLICINSYSADNILLNTNCLMFGGLLLISKATKN